MAEEARSVEDRVLESLDLPEDDEAQIEAEAEAEAVPEGEDDPEPDTDDSEETEEPSEEEDQLYEVEYEGKLYQVPQEMKDALMRNKDYTEKTQKLASDRKTVEINITALQKANEQYEFAQKVQTDTLKIQQIDASIEQARQYLRDNLDSLSSTDIEKWRMAIEDSRAERDRIAQDVQKKSTEFQQSLEQSRKELKAKRTEVLKGAIPGWGDELEANLAKYATDSGYTDQEIASASDPRIWVTLFKAQQFDALKAGATQAVKKLGDTPKIKPKSRNPMPSDVRSKLDYKNKVKRKGLTAKDKAKLITDEMANRLHFED